MTAPYKVVLGNAGDALGYFIPSDEYNIGLNESLSAAAGDVSRAEVIELIEADVF